MINKNLKTKQNTNNFLFLTSNIGITLIALIVTIIVMIILVGVTVNIALKGGLFTTAKEAVKQTQIKEYEERIESIRANLEVEKIVKDLIGKAYMDRFEEELKKDSMLKDCGITRESDEKIILVTPEGYVFEITEEETKYLGEQNKSDIPPTLTESDTKILYDPSGWTNGEVTVSVKTEKEGYTLQYSTDGDEWKTYTDPFKVKDNGVVIYARLINNQYQVGGVITGTVLNIDRLNPKSVNIENTTSTTNSITVTASAEDAEATDTNGKSNIAKYYFSRDDGATWEPNEGQKEVEYTFEGLTQGESCKIKVKAEDEAKNQTEINEAQIVTTEKIPGGNDSITFDYSETEWTNQSVNVTITTTADTSKFTLQYSLDENKWTDYTSEIKMNQNGSIYARLQDKQNTNNVGETATGNVENIDKKAPTVTSVTTSDVTTNSVTVTVVATDAEKTMTNGKSKVKYYYFSSDGGFTWTDPQTESRYIFTELNLGNEPAKLTAADISGNPRNGYNIKVKVQDAAGNESR